MKNPRFEMVKERHKKTMKKAVEEGKADEKLKNLLEFIASTKNFFTSSSCAGRILLLGLPKKSTKREAYFHRRWHRTIELTEVMKALKEKTNGEIWLKQEPFILHLGTDSLENANKVLKTMNKAGVKRGGIIVAKKGKFLIELSGTEAMNIPIKSEKKVLIEESFLGFLVEKANKKLEKNYERLKKVEEAMKKELK